MPPSKKPRPDDSGEDSDKSDGNGFFNLLGEIVQKAGPITRQELAMMLLLAVLFVGAIVWLASSGKLTLLAVVALGFIFIVVAVFVFFYTFLPRRGIQSIRQEELKEEVKELRVAFEKTLPKFSRN